HIAAQWEGTGRGRIQQQRQSDPRQRRAVRSIHRYVDQHRIIGHGALFSHGDVASQREGARGGRDQPGSITSAELYDPSTGTWTNTGSMSGARGNHTATVLPNGKVLVAGGHNESTGLTIATAELYDPSTGTWATTSSMN